MSNPLESDIDGLFPEVEGTIKTNCLDSELEGLIESIILSMVVSTTIGENWSALELLDVLSHTIKVC